MANSVNELPVIVLVVTGVVGVVEPPPNHLPKKPFFDGLGVFATGDGATVFAIDGDVEDAGVGDGAAEAVAAWVGVAGEGEWPAGLDADAGTAPF